MPVICSPRALELGIIKEAVLRDNIDIFRKNGFEFRFDDEGMYWLELLQRVRVFADFTD